MKTDKNNYYSYPSINRLTMIDVSSNILFVRKNFEKRTYFKGNHLKNCAENNNSKIINCPIMISNEEENTTPEICSNSKIFSKSKNSSSAELTKGVKDNDFFTKIRNYKNLKDICRKVLKNNKGSLFVESSIAFPLIIFVCFFIILLSINTYIDLLYSVRISDSLNQSVDKETKTIIDESKNLYLSKFEKQVNSSKMRVNKNRSYFTANKNFTYTLLKFFKIRYTHNLKENRFIINEEEMLRRSKFFP